MSHQLTFADSEFSNKRRKARKKAFLSLMDELIPWDPLEMVITSVMTNTAGGIGALSQNTGMADWPWER